LPQVAPVAGSTENSTPGSAYGSCSGTSSGRPQAANSTMMAEAGRTTRRLACIGIIDGSLGGDTNTTTRHAAGGKAPGNGDNQCHERLIAAAAAAYDPE